MLKLLIFRSFNPIFKLFIYFFHKLTFFSLTYLQLVDVVEEKKERKKVQHFKSLSATVYTNLVFLCESSKKSIKGKIFFNAKKTKIPQFIQKKRLNNLKLELKEQNVNNFNNVDMRY